MTMRLLYVIDSLAPGGAETSLAAMASGLIAGGIDLHVLPLAHRLDLAPQLEAAGATVHAPPSRAGRLPNVKAVLETARALRPHLIHTTLFEADVAGRTAARMLGIPSSTSLVNDSYDTSHYAESSTAKLQAARVLDTATARFAVRFHAISQAIAERVAPRIHVPPDRVEVIPRGRDPRDFPFQPTHLRERTRQSLAVPPTQSVILSVGRLEPQKGHQHLLRALPTLTQTHPNLVILIAGKEGRASDELRSEAAGLALDIRFIGHRTDVAALMAAADVFCFPSEREGLGGVLIEAMAVGCPIVASAIPTSREVLRSEAGMLGVLVPPKDYNGLADAIHQVLTHPHDSEVLIRAAREWFDRHYTLRAISQEMLDFFYRAAGP